MHGIRICMGFAVAAVGVAGMVACTDPHEDLEAAQVQVEADDVQPAGPLTGRKCGNKPAAQTTSLPLGLEYTFSVVDKVSPFGKLIGVDCSAASVDDVRSAGPTLTYKCVVDPRGDNNPAGAIRVGTASAECCAEFVRPDKTTVTYCPGPSKPRI